MILVFEEGGRQTEMRKRDIDYSKGFAKKDIEEGVRE